MLFRLLLHNIDEGTLTGRNAGSDVGNSDWLTKSQGSARKQLE